MCVTFSLVDGELTDGERQLSHLLGRRQLLGGNNVSHFAKSVNDCKYEGVSIVAGLFSEKVQGIVEPWVARDRQRQNKCPWGLVGGLELTAGDAGLNVAPDVIIQRGPNRTSAGAAHKSAAPFELI